MAFPYRPATKASAERSMMCVPMETGIDAPHLPAATVARA